MDNLLPTIMISKTDKGNILQRELSQSMIISFQTPQLFFNTIDTSIDWAYRNEPQGKACRSYTTKTCAWPRGKVLGGCSSINGLYYVRANKIDYDEWAADGNKGWSYEEVLPYFRKSENYSEPLTGDTKKYHGNEGYLSIEQRDDTHDFEKLIIKAAMENGLQYSEDINGADQMGVTKCATTTKDGVRHSTARAFLSSVKDRKNLHVLKNALVTKILFKPNSNVVNGVIVNKGGKDITIKAKKEVVLSAGAINTPQLMLLSGIGPKKQLEELKIEVKADLPVGENLQDHLYVPLIYTAPGDKNMMSVPKVIGAFATYILDRAGPLATTAPFRVISFMNTTDPQSTSPDIENHYVVFPPSVTNMLDMHKVHGFSEEVQKKFRQVNENNFAIMVAVTLLKPKSVGKIVLKSKNPKDYPLIYANYFEDDEDLKTVLRGIKQHALKLGETPAFKNNGYKIEWLGLDACKKYDTNTDEFLECWSREMTTSLYHPTSTARMGPDSDETAVVDSELKVKKVKGLRVIDASIMPAIVRGNTNAPTIMIGEKGADMIKKFWSENHTEL